MQKKQLDELKRLDSNLRNTGVVSQPSLKTHVMLALVSGETPKMKPADKISQTARTKIVASSYGSRTLEFADVFASCNGYEAEMKIWKAYEAKRIALVSKYNKASQKIMLSAMSMDAEPERIADLLNEAAESSGLKDLKAPVFNQTDED